MAIKSKKSILSENRERSLMNLAELVGIPLDGPFMGELAKWLGFKDQSALSKWINKGIPRRKISLIEKRGYPRDQWLIPEDEEIVESAAITDTVTAEVIRPARKPPVRYLHPPEHMLPRPSDTAMDKDASDRSDIDNHQVSRIYEESTQYYLSVVKTILESGDAGTAQVLKGTIKIFADHVRLRVTSRE